MFHQNSSDQNILSKKVFHSDSYCGIIGTGGAIMSGTLGEKIKHYRKLKGYSQEKLAEKTSLSKMSIRRYESGKRQPKLETIEKIAIALGEPISHLTNFTLKEYEQTQEHKRSFLEFNAREAILAILADIYGKAERKEMCDGNVDPYYVIGNRPSTFFLHENDIGILFNATKTNIPFLVDALKDTRSEEEIIREYEELTEIPQYTKKDEKEIHTADFSKELTPEKDYSHPNAAHERTDIEVIEEMKKHDAFFVEPPQE